MDEINIDLESIDHKDLNVSLDNKNTPPQQINVMKSNEVTSPSGTTSPSFDGPKEANIGIDLLVNKKKKSDIPINNNVASIKKDPPTNFFPSTSFSSNDTPNLEPSKPPASEPMISNDLDLDKLLSDDDDLGGDILGNASSEPKNNNSSENIFSLNDNKPEEIKIDDPPTFTNTIPVSSTPTPPPKTFEEIQQEKAELLRLFDSLEARGIRVDKKFTMQSDLSEMKMEYDRIKRKRETEQSIKFQRKMLIAFVTAIEFLNGRFDPFDIKLDGWSESVHENVHDYDDVFEELHEKYKSKAQIAPELKLMLMLGGSGFMFHLTNTMFKSSIPGMGDVMKQNPDLMQQFAKAASENMAQQNPGFGNLMGDLMGGGSMPQARPQRQSAPPQRREMSGPPNIDDILSDISASNNSKNVDIDMQSNYSESDIDQARNITMGKNNKKSLNLNL